MPAVSVCVPTYNRASTLIQTLRTVLGQTMQDFELIVCDNCSSDDTRGVVGSLNDPRIRYHRNQTNVGMFGNWNQCIALAGGRYVAIFHDDDIYEPTILECLVAALENHPRAGFAHSAAWFIDDGGQIIGKTGYRLPAYIPGGQLRALLATRWDSPIIAASVVARRECYERVGPYDEALRVCGDLDMWVRLGAQFDSVYVDRRLVRIRLGTRFRPRFSWDVIREYPKVVERNIGRVYGDRPVVHGCFLRLSHVRRDAEFLKRLAWAATEAEDGLLDDGLRAMREDCSLWAVVVARWVIAPTWSHRILARLRRLYRCLYSLRPKRFPIKPVLGY